MKKKIYYLSLHSTLAQLFTFNISVEASRQFLPVLAVVVDGDPDLVPGEDDVRPGAALSHSVAAPPGLEAVLLSLHLDVGSDTVHGVGGGQVVEGDQQVQVPLGLEYGLYLAVL